MKRSHPLSFSTVVSLSVAAIATTIVYFSLIWPHPTSRSPLAKIVTSTPKDNYELVSKYCSNGVGCHLYCSYINCLWRGNEENKDAVFGLATLTGYYATSSQLYYGDEPVECDSFVITEGPEPLLSFYRDWIAKGNGLRKLNGDNRIVMNINIDSLPKEYSEGLLNSSAENPIEVVAFQQPPAGKGAAECGITAKILEINTGQIYRNDKFGYQVKLPPGSTITKIPSGIEGADDLGSVVDFSLDSLSIRITAMSNSRHDTSLEKLIEKRSNVGMALFVDDSTAYKKIQVSGQPAFQYSNYAGDGEKRRRNGETTLLLGRDYYYQITTGNQYTPEYSSEMESAYHSFVNTFKLIP